jgi:hypothetical protein
MAARHTFDHPTTHQRSDSVQEYEDLKRMLDEISDDIKKAEGGNKAAGTRVRKQMQDVKNLAQDIRKKILEFRDDSS